MNDNILFSYKPVIFLNGNGFTIFKHGFPET